MGYYYSELIAPAVLFDNPGVTASEYTRLLDQTDRYFLYSPADPYRLAKKLSLAHTRQFKNFNQSTTDFQGLEIFPPSIFPYQPYEVRVHLSNTLLPSKRYQIIDCDEIKSNTIIPIGVPYEEKFCLVDKVVQIQKRSLPNNNTAYYCEIDPKKQYYNFFIEGRELIRNFQCQRFDNIEDLFKNWPQFVPENVYDFSVNHGSFFTGHSSIGIENFCWLMNNGRYFLDPITFDKIPAGGNIRKFGVGYTDLIITSEIIKNNGLDLLGYNSRDKEQEVQLQNFLDRHPQSRSRVNIAVWDAHTSIYAKNKGMTHFDFIRFRVPHDP